MRPLLWPAHIKELYTKNSVNFAFSESVLSRLKLSTILVNPELYTTLEYIMLSRMPDLLSTAFNEPGIIGDVKNQAGNSDYPQWPLKAGLPLIFARIP